MIIRRRMSGSRDFSADARLGLVDQTRDEAVGESGRNAMEPVGKNRWYAVIGAWGYVGAWNIVATMACVSYAHPYVSMPAYFLTGEL